MDLISAASDDYQFSACGLRRLRDRRVLLATGDLSRVADVLRI